MCGVTPSSPVMPQSSVAETAAPAAPTTTGGGLATPPVDVAAIVPVLQQLVTALQAVVQALQGAGTVAGGPAQAGAMGAPSAAATGAASGAAHAGHPPTKGGGGGAEHGEHAGAAGHHGMKIIKSTKPADPARAQANLNAVYDTFARHGRQGLDFKHNQTHGYLSENERNAFRTANPGLPVPQSLVFRAGSNVPIGAVYRSGAGASGDFDLGMGDRHVHNDNPKSQMQHIWFTPNHPDFAFSDVAHGMTGSTAAAMKKLGYPT